MKHSGEDYQGEVTQMLQNFIREHFEKSLEDIKLVICGVELQTCGGLLKYLDHSIPVMLIDFDLRKIGCSYDGYECYPPENAYIHDDNAIFLISMLYEYQCNEIMQGLECLGVPRNRMIWCRSLAEKIMIKTANYFAAARMDLKVKALFDHIGRDISAIKYMDIGTNNFCLYNNTYLFYKAGASGVLIEANPEFTEILKANRPRDTLLTCGCTAGDCEGEMTYYKTNRAGYNTFVKERSNCFGRQDVYITETMQLPTRPINQILAEYFPEKHIDYVSVDIEGMGQEVVSDIDFHTYGIDVILVELNDYFSESARSFYLKLVKLGYKMVYKGIGGGGDFLFYRKDVFGEIL